MKGNRKNGIDAALIVYTTVQFGLILYGVKLENLFLLFLRLVNVNPRFETQLCQWTPLKIKREREKKKQSSQSGNDLLTINFLTFRV